MSIYNSEKFLDKSIQSILNQTFKNFEFIIINDCSTDNSLRIIKEYIKKDKRIKLIKNTENIGLTKSLNKGLRKAKGRYIARMDADDISLPERFQIQYDYLEQHPNIFLIGGGALNIDEKEIIRTINKTITGSDLIKKNLYSKNCIYHPTIMFRNEKNIFYREKFKYAQDYDFYLMLLSKGKIFGNLREPLIKYRINSKAVSWYQKSKQRLFEIKAREFYHQRLKYDKDEYSKFNPKEILNLDVENSTDKIVLESEIKASFKLNDFKRTRKFCRKYFKHYRFNNRMVIYYFLSFTGENIVNFLRGIKYN